MSEEAFLLAGSFVFNEQISQEEVRHRFYSHLLICNQASARMEALCLQCVVHLVEKCSPVIEMVPMSQEKR